MQPDSFVVDVNYTDFLAVEMGPTGCTETSVGNYHYTLLNIPEERRPLLRRKLVQLPRQ